jgi:hypothetical protein
MVERDVRVIAEPCQGVDGEEGGGTYGDRCCQQRVHRDDDLVVALRPVGLDGLW